MSRATRVEFPGAIYHAMGLAMPEAKAFPGDEHREWFLKSIGQMVESGDLEMHAFCLMTTHYHLLVETPHGSLSRWMHRLLSDYTQWFNVRERRFGHLWKGRYKAILVERGPYLLECSRYIHLNPNRSGLSRPAERWKWSSYRNYVAGLGKPAVPWVTTKTVLGELGTTGVSEKQARRAYREYVESGKGEAPIDPLERATAGLVLGSETFVAWVRERLEGRRDSPDEPSLRRLRALGLASPDRIEEAVGAEFGDSRVKGRARNILAAMLVSRTGLRPAEVARLLGVSRSAVTKSVLRVDEIVRRDPAVARKVRRISADLMREPRGDA